MKMSACLGPLHSPCPIHTHSDLQTRRTLRMLYNEHTRAAKELQRRIVLLREEGIDPTLPQKLTPPRPSPASALTAHGSSPSPPAHQRERLPDSQVDESFMLLGQQVRTTCIYVRTPCHSASCARSRRMLAIRLTRFGGPWSSSTTLLSLWRLPRPLLAFQTPHSASWVGMAAIAATLIQMAAGGTGVHSLAVARNPNRQMVLPRQQLMMHIASHLP
jgi:hypothetical protein